MIQDIAALDCELHYFRTKDGVEIDFLITLDDEPVICFEVKTSDRSPSKSFALFKKQVQIPFSIQLVLNLGREFDTEGGIMVRDLVSFLTIFDLVTWFHRYEAMNEGKQPSTVT